MSNGAQNRSACNKYFLIIKSNFDNKIAPTSREECFGCTRLTVCILLTKDKIPKLSFYKRKTLLETIAFFSEWFSKTDNRTITKFNSNASKFYSVIVN